MPPHPPSDLATLSPEAIAALLADKKLPPVERWNPGHCGDSEMRIARDGSWFHQGEPIRRPELVRLFSTILRREADGGFVLVTPAEKLSIAVEDAPFVAVELRVETQSEERLIFRLNTGELIAAGADHPLCMKGSADAPRPYLAVRRGLDALVTRSVFYELADRAVAGDGDGMPGVWSRGTFFPLVPHG